MNDKKELTTAGSSESFSLVPKSLDEAMKFADIIAKTDMVPKDYKGKPGNILIAMQMGLEVGLPPLQALQNIAVINGRPAIWGDSAIALVKVHPKCEYIHEYYIDKDENKTTKTEQISTAVCVVKRRGQGEESRIFSIADAKKARLWGKGGVWSDYPLRMLQMRARGFALRDVFPDALKGLSIAEEAQDIPPEKDITPSAGTKKELQVESPMEVPVIEQGEDSVVVNQQVNEELESTVRPYIERLNKLKNKFEAQNWFKKHSTGDILDLPREAQDIVMGHYKTIFEGLMADEHVKEEEEHSDHESMAIDYELKIREAKTIEELDEIFGEFQDNVTEGKLIVPMRRVRDERAQEIKG